jgi:DNA-binding transcriptional regulator PaaX
MDVRAMMGAVTAVFAEVKASDTAVESLIEKLGPQGHDEAMVRYALDRLCKQSSIAEVRPGVYQRWHGQDAQRVLYPKGG